jgi:hypothetical protein
MQWQQFRGVQRVQIHGLTRMERVEIDRLDGLELDGLEIELRRAIQGSRPRRHYCLVNQRFIQVPLNRPPYLRLDSYRGRRDEWLGRLRDDQGRARFGTERRCWLRLHDRESIEERL